MKTKLIIVVVLVGTAAAVGVVRTASTIQQKRVPDKNSLKWYANEAKNKGCSCGKTQTTTVYRRPPNYTRCPNSGSPL